MVSTGGTITFTCACHAWRTRAAGGGGRCSLRIQSGRWHAPHTHKGRAHPAPLPSPALVNRHAANRGAVGAKEVDDAKSAGAGTVIRYACMRALAQALNPKPGREGSRLGSKVRKRGPTCRLAVWGEEVGFGHVVLRVGAVEGAGDVAQQDRKSSCARRRSQGVGHQLSAGPDRRVQPGGVGLRAGRDGGGGVWAWRVVAGRDGQGRNPAQGLLCRFKAEMQGQCHCSKQDGSRRRRRRRKCACGTQNPPHEWLRLQTLARKGRKMRPRVACFRLSSGRGGSAPVSGLEPKIVREGGRSKPNR